MTDDEIARWAAGRPGWKFALEQAELEYAWNRDECITVCCTEPSYAECQGPDDPVCGLARFSVHGCNGAPTRAEFVSWHYRTLRRKSPAR